MNKPDNDDVIPFDLKPVESGIAVLPKEPLYSMLMTCSEDALLFTHKNLLKFSEESQLDDHFPEVGLNRRAYIEQVQLAINHRKFLGVRHR